MPLGAAGEALPGSQRVPGAIPEASTAGTLQQPCHCPRAVPGSLHSICPRTGHSRSR